MKTKIYKVIAGITWAIGLFGIIYAFWYFSDPTKFPVQTPPTCLSGWFIDRRFGEDEFLGEISAEKARQMAGENIIYYGVYNNSHCRT